MHKEMSIHTPLTQRHWLLRILLVLGFIIAFVGSTATTHAGGIPGGNVADPVVRAVDIAEPAVVRIITTLGGHLTVHFSNTNSVTFPQGTGNSYQLVLSGTGTFISAHGDILTADHVVNPPPDQSLSQFLDQEAAPDVTNYYNQHVPSNNQATQNQILQALESGQLPSYPQYDTPSSEAYLSTAYTGPLTAPDIPSIPAQFHATVDRIEQQSSFDQKDVAIIHVNMNDMASVQLGDSSTVQQQDELTIIGFPGNGDVSSKPTDLLTSSVNKITVSSIKTTDTGAQVIQVGGNVEHGDSGGPALNSQGSVVGIVSFGLSSSGSPGGTSFLQASNSARELLQALNLDTTPGPFEKAWSQAFTDYAATTNGHWHKAQQEFESIVAKYPLFKAITPYLTYAQTQAKNEQLSSSPGSGGPSSSNPITAYMWTIVGVGGIVILVVILVAVQRRRGRKPSGRPAIAQSSSSAVPISPAAPPLDEGMAAFGAPSSLSSPIPPSSNTNSNLSGTLRPWPCGHMNRSTARFCSICGEPAPSESTIRRVEQ